MIKRWHEPMQHWSRERGLEFHPDGLLPAWTRVLAKGSGAGAHRASLVINQSDSSQTSTGGLTKYPERGHHHLCRGVLPGGLEGVVAHQLHLALDCDAARARAGTPSPPPSWWHGCRRAPASPRT